MQNLFENIPQDLPGEVFESIVKRDNLHLERIVSSGQSTPPGEWLSQSQDEWVVLLSGEAELSFKEGAPNFKMIAGSYVFIESEREHRVERTSTSPNAVWLAVHFPTEV